MKPVAMHTGYTKTQTLIVTFGIMLGLLTLVQGTQAKEWIPLDTLKDAQMIGKEYMRPPQASILALSKSEKEQKTEERRHAYRQKDAVGVTYMDVSAYNSVPGQTDGSPYHTAIGSLTRDGVVATNYFPIGTKIRIPDHFGDKIFRVEDRMNPRYNKTLDIWMEEIPDAKAWGRKYVKIEIVSYGLGRGVE